VFTATAVVTVLFAAALAHSGTGKLRRDPRQIAGLREVRFPPRLAPLLALAELAGAAGIVAGLFWWPIGIAAAVCLITYFVSAVAAHLRVEDTGFGPALIFLTSALSVLVLAC
jgi:uncharacterized membrane protein YphA (DoxX/SURF4 family)